MISSRHLHSHCSVRSLTCVPDASNPDATDTSDAILSSQQASSSATATSPVVPRRSERETTLPERFSDSKYSKWSAYDMSRHGKRHDLEEACSAEPEYTTELEALYSRLRAAASAATGADPTSEFVGEMERVAATTLHAALIECLASAGMDKESSHIWAGNDAETASFTVCACMPGVHDTRTDASPWATAGHLATLPTVATCNCNPKPSLHGSV